MKKHCSRLAASVLLCWAGALCGGVCADSFIARDGQPKAEIIIDAKPARMVKLAAEELQNYIEKITGARLPIMTAPTNDMAVKIYVGKSGYTDALKLSDADLEYGAFRMVSGTNWLALLGRDSDFVPPDPHAKNGSDIPRALAEWDARTGETWGNPLDRSFNLFKQYNKEMNIWQYDECGSLHAVDAFLRDQGIRWYFPGADGEVVPKYSTITLPVVNQTVRPDFALRDLHQGRMQFFASDKNEVMWQLRLGLNLGFRMVGPKPRCHGMVSVHSRKEVMVAHPEYYAIWGGTRMTKDNGRPCLSSQGLFEQHVKYVRTIFDVYNFPMVDISLADGYATLCQCELCRGKGTPERGYTGQMSDYAWSYLDRVAREVSKTHPDRKVSALVYSAYRLPPEKIDMLSPNLVLFFCQHRSAFDNPETRKAELELRKAWLEKLPSKEIYIYDYYLHSRPGFPMEGVPVYFPRLIAEDLRSLKGVSQGEFVEGDRTNVAGSSPGSKKDALAANHLNVYVTSRLYWDANQDVDALLSEYYEKFYGPAAGQMKAFVEYSEKNWRNANKDVAIIDRMVALLDAARKPAGDTIFGRRIDMLAEYMKPMKELREQIAKGREGVPEARARACQKTDIRVDGKLDEKIWDKYKPVFPLRELQTGAEPGNKTYFRVLWADDNLYFGIRCEDNDMSNLKISTTNNEDQNIWFGDCVEILLETHDHSYYQFTLNPAGAMFDLDRKDGKLNMPWNSGAEVAAYVGTNYWSLEVRIPVAGENQEQLDPLNGVSGRRPSETYPWFFNVCRQRVRNLEKQHSAFSPTGKPGFNYPMKFGKLWTNNH